MKTAALVPLEEYLRTTYRPDCDYVDGEVIERNVGERDHGKLQGEIYFYFRLRAAKWNVRVYLEQRVQVSASRFRVPDVCVVLGKEPDEQVFTKPPFICIEVLSPDDRLGRVQQRVDDYLKFGVPNVWVLDPWSRRAWVYDTEGSREVKDGFLRTAEPAMEIPLSELFETS